MGYEIYSYGNNIALSALFNAIASITRSQTYLTMVYLVFVVGFFVAFAAMAAGRDRWAGPRWLVTSVLIYLVLLVPTATVQIVDKTNNLPPAVIDNVPWGLASQASVVSDVGNTLTELFETAVQIIPAAGGGTALSPDLTYQKTGLMFGAKLVKDTHNLVFSDAEFRNQFTQFFANCTVYDLAQGHPSANDFINSTDIWPLMADTNPARYSTMTVPDGTGGTMTDSRPCPQIYADLNTKMNAEERKLMARLGLKGTPALLERSPGIAGAGALQLIAATAVENPLLAAYQSAHLAGAATDAATIVRQNAVINGIKDGGMLLSQQQGDTAALMMEQAKSIAVSQTNSQYVLSQQIAEDTLPMIRNGLEAVSYALFPLILLFCLIHGGHQAVEILKTYALVLIWVALWPPLYAVLSFLMSIAAWQAIAGSAYANGVQGLTLATAGAVYSTSISKLAVAGYMTTLVPMIASAVVFGLNKMANSALAVTGVADRAVASASNDVARGNLSMGNVGMNKVSTAKSDNSSFQKTWDDAYGKTSVDIRDPGSMRHQTNMSNFPLSMSSDTAIAQRESQAASKSADLAQSQTRTATEAKTAAVMTALSHMRSSGSSTESGTGFGFGTGGSTQKTAEAVQQARAQLGRDLGITDSNAVDRVFSTSLAAKTTLSTPGAALLPASASISAEVKAAGSTKSTEQIQAAISKSWQTMDSHGIKDADGFVTDFKKSDTWKHMQSSGDQDAKRIESSMNTARSAQSAASVSFQKSEQHRETAEKAAAIESKFGINFANAFTGWVNKYHPGVIGPNRNPSEDRLAELGAEFIRDSVVVKNADNTFKMVQRSEMGVMTITPGSNKEAELKARMATADLGSPRVAANDAADVNATHAANDRQVLAAGGTGTGGSTGTAPQSRSAAQTRHDTHMAEMQAKIKAAGTTMTSSAASAREDFGQRSGETSPAQNLGTNNKAMDALHRDPDAASWNPEIDKKNSMSALIARDEAEDARREAEVKNKPSGKN